MLIILKLLYRPSLKLNLLNLSRKLKYENCTYTKVFHILRIKVIQSHTHTMDNKQDGPLLSLWVLTNPCLICFLRYTLCFNHITISKFLYHIFIVCNRVLHRMVHGKMVNVGPQSQNFINNNTINFNDTTFLHWIKMFTLVKTNGRYNSRHLIIRICTSNYTTVILFLLPYTIN